VDSFFILDYVFRDFLELFTKPSLDRRSACGFPGVYPVFGNARGNLKMSKISGTLGIDEGFSVLLFFEADL
jgi:hypothetical protein